MLKSWYCITWTQAGIILFFSFPCLCHIFRINWDNQTEPNNKLRLLRTTWSERSLVIKLLESSCAWSRHIYFSLESWFWNSSSCDKGISLKSLGVGCSCSVDWWLTDSPSSCSRLESITNRGTGHSRFLEIFEIGQESENNGLTSFVPVPWGRREGPVPLHREITRVWCVGRKKSLAKSCWPDLHSPDCSSKGEKNLSILGLLKQGGWNLSVRANCLETGVGLRLCGY